MDTSSECLALGRLALEIPEMEPGYRFATVLIAGIPFAVSAVQVCEDRPTVAVNPKHQAEVDVYQSLNPLLQGRAVPATVEIDGEPHFVTVFPHEASEVGSIGEGDFALFSENCIEGDEDDDG